ncbi:hypothetical protein GYMLUDRAFT_58188 [Collybiopsis luxurians FD-317 M1]|uniref:Nucleolar protein 12 n=1 Tax=Collybiopsis luxurians FD-317 M1 TaxID=944289 RepID=A0A0D0D0B5_9AGAR|nr:hypothetical protein GYMLUDRAFT_58188 [Collybiopsis luxurians FD-317 M1]
MALSSFLQTYGRKTAVVDTELDALFKSSSGSSKPSAAALPPSSILGSEKRKRKHEDISSVIPKYDLKKKRVKSTEEQEKGATSSYPNSPRKAESRKKTEKASGLNSKKPAEEDTAMESESDEDENDSELENAYLSRTLKRKDKGKGPESPDEEQNDGDKFQEESEDHDGVSSEDNSSPPQHESLTKKQRTKKVLKSKTRYVPPDETPEQRNARTIFIGNLSVEVSQKKSLLKSLHRHILSLIHSDSSSVKPQIESTRFRSVPFAVPTSNLENDDEKLPTKKGKSKSSTKARQHDIDRTSSWKISSGEKGEEEIIKGEKQFLTPAQKKKIAFINQEIHASGSSVNAYIVFAHPVPSSASGEVSARRSNLPPLPGVMDPYEAANFARERCDGSEFMERTLRVDVVAHNVDVSAVEGQGRVIRTGSDVDPKRCVFVGNLDFESKEEDVRAFFEGVISTEKGPRVARENEPDDDEGEEEEDETSVGVPLKKGWVTRVRIIRDKDTQMGKGFAYVQFAERDCVDEILAAALEPGKLKFAKRKLRVERCKTIPGASLKVNAKSSKPKNSSSSSGRQNHSSNPSTPVSIPKGDPTLGTKLAHLSKEERKSVKAADADRMARRLAKKRARMAMATPRGVQDGQGAGGVKIQGKDRVRERKPRNGGAFAGKKGKGHGAGSATKNKGKVISVKALEKRNVKK